jgi:hypothetical protein
VRALDEIGAPYMIVGAFAGLSFGITRATFDVDILVDLSAAARMGHPVLSLWSDLVDRAARELESRDRD